MNHIEIYGLTVCAIWVLTIVGLAGMDGLPKFVLRTVWTIVTILAGTLLVKLFIALILE